MAFVVVAVVVLVVDDFVDDCSILVGVLVSGIDTFGELVAEVVIVDFGFVFFSFSKWLVKVYS